MRTLGVWALCLVVLSRPLPAQQPEPQGGAVFRVTSTLVQVDAVVTDSKGRQVTNLAPADFEIYADGKLQKISSLSYVNLAPESVPLPPQQKAKDTSTSRPPASTPRREDIRRTVVLMVDDLNLSFESMAFVRSSLLKFVDRQMQPGDLIAICRTGGGSGALQQFTADPHLARAIIGSLRWNPNGVADASFFAPVDHATDLRSTIQKQIDRGSDQRADRRDSPLLRNPDVPLFDNSLTHGPGSAQLEALRHNTLLVGALGAIDAVIQALRDMPGRKSVVLFSDGFNLDFADDRVVNSMRRLVDRANRAGTLIYTMHAAGLQVLLPTAGDNPDLNGRNSQAVQSALESIESNRTEQEFIAQQGLDYLARATGGLPYFNGNDLNFGLGRVIEDQRGYYLLGYSPPADTFDPKKGERPFHHLRVLVNVKGLSVHSRSGFFGATDEEIAPKPASLSPAQQLVKAMLSPFSSSDIHLRLTPIYAETPGIGSVVRNLLDIDMRDLSFKTTSDGSSEALVKLAVFAVGVDNKPLTLFSKDYKFSFQAAELERIRRTGFLYTLEIELPKPGGYQIRAAVRDEATLKLGSAHAYLEVPDLGRRHLALTSVVLSDAQSEVIGYAAARRQFQRGTILRYFCLLQSDNDRFDAADIEAKLRLVSEGRQIYLGPVKITELPDHRHAITGELKLGSAIPTGTYFLQVIASAGASSKPVTADQWTDFEIEP